MKLCSLDLLVIPQLLVASAIGEPVPLSVHDGSHVRRLPDRLVGSNAWMEYDGHLESQKVIQHEREL
jgi:hypothetical protein